MEMSYHSRDESFRSYGHNRVQDDTRERAIPMENRQPVNDADDRYSPQTRFQICQVAVRRFIEHCGFRIFTAAVVILGFIAVIIELIFEQYRDQLEIISLSVSSYFMVEILLRIFAKGVRNFFYVWINILDLVIVVILFIAAVTYTAAYLSHHVRFIKLVVLGRFVHIIILLTIEKTHLENASRQTVSQNKRRYQRGGFDLDLCYVTDRVIAMSFPSSGVMAMYRNPIKRVAEFLDAKHKDHYKVFNLCSEQGYDESLFHHQVERLHIDDHNVPKLAELLRFVETVRGWMDVDRQNVIAVHCKGGKGRTGTMICAWLLESGQFSSAQESLNYFGVRRTDRSVGQTFQGVETPSQSRYVGYFEICKTKFNGRHPPPRDLKLKSIVVKGLAGIGLGNGSDLSCEIITSNTVYEYNFKQHRDCKTTFDCATASITISITDSPTLTNDVKVKFYCSSKLPAGYDGCPFFFWFHTSLVEGNRFFLSREELDNPHKPKTWKKYSEDFGVGMEFDDMR